MSETDRFSSLVRNVRKRYRGVENGDGIQELEDAFVSCMVYLPEDLKCDLYRYFLETYGGSTADEKWDVLTDKLLELTYLFEGEYERATESFSLGDWEFIRESVSDFALDLDQETLTYVMKQIVSRGLIG